jgi:hypothetical protein
MEHRSSFVGITTSPRRYVKRLANLCDEAKPDLNPTKRKKPPEGFHLGDPGVGSGLIMLQRLRKR